MKLSKNTLITSALFVLGAGIVWYIIKKNKNKEEAKILAKETVEQSSSNVTSGQVAQANQKLEQVAKKVLTAKELADIEAKAIQMCSEGACKNSVGAAKGGCMSGCVPDTKNKLTNEALAKK